MAKRVWGSLDRWLLAKRAGQWFIDPPRPLRMYVDQHWYPTFVEAHAAYLDAVTCNVPSTWSGVKYRCVRSKGHTGFHMRPRP